MARFTKKSYYGYGKHRRRRAVSPESQLKSKLINQEQAINEWKRNLPTVSQQKDIEAEIRRLTKWLDRNLNLFHRKIIALRKIEKIFDKWWFIPEFFFDPQMRKDKKKLESRIKIFKEKKQKLKQLKTREREFASQKNQLYQMESKASSLRIEYSLASERRQLKAQEKSERQQRKSAKNELTRAKAAAYDGKRREQAQGSKSRVFQQQILVSDRCPYCNTVMAKGNTHCDHIIPMDKGGLSHSRNLVHACKRCNQKKSNKTVRQFCKSENLDYDVVASRLEALNKDV